MFIVLTYSLIKVGHRSSNVVRMRWTVGVYNACEVGLSRLKLGDIIIYLSTTLTITFNLP